MRKGHGMSLPKKERTHGVESKSKILRSGYTTGACAAAAAKAATLILMRNYPSPQPSPPRGEGVFHPLPSEGEERGEGAGLLHIVEIPFPDGSRATFRIHDAGYRMQEKSAYASVIKDAGDDPDVTHGAEIVATVRSAECGVRSEDSKIIIKGGAGVGTVTKPGLAIPVGEPAINPVPRKMISEAVSECGVRSAECGMKNPNWEVTISVPQGEEIAKKTLNNRLGIIGGISILGTTGIVKPLSTEAWTATITSSMDVAKAMGIKDIVISTGRTSEKAHMKKFHYPEEAYVMMGDYLEISLQEASSHGFKAIHLCAQWAKMIKTAMEMPQTHVRHGTLESEHARDFLINLGINIPKNKAFNTSREIFDYIQSKIGNPESAMARVCYAARRYAEGITLGIPVIAHLVSYEGEIIAASG